MTNFDDWRTVIAARIDVASRRACGEVEARSSSVPLPGDGFSQRFQLSPNESIAVWTLVIAQLVPDLAMRLEALAGGPEVTLGALAAIAYDDMRSALVELSERGTLFRNALVERIASGTEHASWARRTVRATDAAMALALDVRDQHADSSLHGLIDSGELEPRRLTSLAIDEGTAEELASAARANAHVLVVGLPGSGRCTALAAALSEQGKLVLRIDARNLASDPEVLCSQLRAISRECHLLDRVPLFDDLDQATHRDIGGQIEAVFEGAIAATCGVRGPKLELTRPTIVIEMLAPSTRQLTNLWREALPTLTAKDAQHLGEQHPLSPALIVRTANVAATRAAGRMLELADVKAGIQAVVDRRLGDHARRLIVTQTWDDVVLSQDQFHALVELTARIRGRSRVYEEWGFAVKVGKGLGVTALFSGPPGTGKSMVAGLVARELGLEIYQVDMGKLVSKYIGETEKNLGALFDAAEAGHAILLFDEADALFGKRTDVKSSNDRYANLETNYLLQRIESFKGICILTSNHETHIDPAFQRRLSAHIRFDLPEEPERTLLWRATIPETAPIEANIDFAALGRRYVMSGGYIRNAALRAAFLAAEHQVSISEALLHHAARIECEAMGRIPV